RGVEPRARGAARGTAAAGPGRQAAQAAVRDAGHLPAAALPPLRERPPARDARLRLLGRERAPAPLRPRGRPRLHRLRDLAMRGVVGGAGSWGSAFSCLLRDAGHSVTLAARDPEQVDAIAESARNPRYAMQADLRGVAATTIADAPIVDAELVVVAVP